MDKRIKELIDFSKEKFCLHEYYLHTYDIERTISLFDETIYILCMEWFPNHILDWKDETYNPEGTVYVELDVHSRKTKRVIFSRGVSYVDDLMFDFHNKDEIINWIEKETGLIYNKQFMFWKEEESELQFRTCIDGYAVSPSGYIQFKLDNEGRLTLFSVDGHIPSNTLVQQEEYVLSLEKVEELAKEQLKLIEFPVVKRKKLVAAYAIEEIYVKNDDSTTLPFEYIVDERSRVKVDKVLEWEETIRKPFQSIEISLDEKITPDQAFRCEQHPDLRRITDEELQKCMEAIQKFMSQEYMNDSGMWKLKSLHREKGYIHATLKVKEQKECVFKRKLKLFIDSSTYEVLNYMDTKPFIEIYNNLLEAEEIKITKEEAFERLKEYIEITPYYVYDVERDSYVLCGLLDCHSAVKAFDGEIVSLSEL